MCVDTCKLTSVIESMTSRDEHIYIYKYLKNPSVNWVMPAKKVAVNARRRYSSASFTGSISFCRRLPSKRDTTATGPIAMSLELPMKA